MTEATRKEIDLLIYEMFPEDLTPEQMEELTENRLSWLQTMEADGKKNYQPEHWTRMQELKNKALREESNIEYFILCEEIGKSYTTYSNKNGQYYRQHCNYSSKNGYTIPGTCKRISAKEFFKMYAAHRNSINFYTPERWQAAWKQKQSASRNA